jgi:hypothetical protein
MVEVWDLAGDRLLNHTKAGFCCEAGVDLAAVRRFLCPMAHCPVQ